MNERIFIPLSPEQVADSKVAAEHKLEEEEKQKALNREKTLKEIPTIFDDPEYFAVEQRLAQIEELFGPDHVVFSKDVVGGNNQYTVKTLRNLFAGGKDYADKIIELRKNINLSLTDEEKAYLNKFYANQGVTSQKIDEQSKLGLRACLIENIDHYIKSSAGHTRMFKIPS